MGDLYTGNVPYAIETSTITTTTGGRGGRSFASGRTLIIILVVVLIFGALIVIVCCCNSKKGGNGLKCLFPGCCEKDCDGSKHKKKKCQESTCQDQTCDGEKHKKRRHHKQDDCDNEDKKWEGKHHHWEGKQQHHHEGKGQGSHCDTKHNNNKYCDKTTCQPPTWTAWTTHSVPQDVKFECPKTVELQVWGGGGGGGAITTVNQDQAGIGSNGGGGGGGGYGFVQRKNVIGIAGTVGVGGAANANGAASTVTLTYKNATSEVFIAQGGFRGEAKFNTPNGAAIGGLGGGTTGAFTYSSQGGDGSLGIITPWGESEALLSNGGNGGDGGGPGGAGGVGGNVSHYEVGSPVKIDAKNGKGPGGGGGGDAGFGLTVGPAGSGASGEIRVKSY